MGVELVLERYWEPGTELGPEGFNLVFCSGQDRDEGVLVRGSLEPGVDCGLVVVSTSSFSPRSKCPNGRGGCFRSTGFWAGTVLG
jgi:hypothetical protein